MLKLKKRDKDNIIRKVLIYGRPGHGKSTFASDYCKKHGLKPVVFDFDDTNFTDDDIVELSLKNDLKTYHNVVDTIKEIKNSEYDTIIIDGLGSLLDKLVSTAKGQRRFLDRSDRFNAIFKELSNSGCHLIFIGQEDCNLENYTENVPNKSIMNVNSIVNETYYCIKEGMKFTQTRDKFRGELEDNKTNLTKNMVSGKNIDSLKNGLKGV
jgi:hypothetical protein